MTSARQIAANRLNARKSTGPRTRNGKTNSRRNAFCHGLTAESVIGNVEDSQAYAAFESALLNDLAPQSTLEQELVARLASLLWRLRRVTLIESGLLQIQHEIMRDQAQTGSDQLRSGSLAQGELDNSRSLVLYQTLADSASAAAKNGDANNRGGTGANFRADPRPRPINGPTEINAKGAARAFLRLANLENEILERLGRYEARLWRRALQTVNMITVIRRERSATPI